MKEKLHFDDFSEQVSLESGFDVDTSSNFIKELFSIYKEHALNQEELTIRNFGHFKTLWHEHRDGVNPNTLDKLTIPAHFGLHFYPAKKLLNSINTAQGYLPSNDHASHAYLGLKHYLSIALIAILVVLSLFWSPVDSPKSEKVTNTMEPKSLFVTVAHGPGHWNEGSTDQELVAVKEDLQPNQSLKKVEHDAPKSLVTASYEVLRDDSLSKIAKSYYGHAEYWPIIYKENRDKINDPDKIFVGDSLKIPIIDDKEGLKNNIYFASAYVDVYKAYRMMNKLKSSQWALWMGVTKIDSCLLADYDKEINKEDIKAVTHYIACNSSEPLKDLP